MILYTTSNLMGIIVSNLMGIIVSNIYIYIYIYILVDGLEHEFILVHRGVQSLVQLGHNIITSFKTYSYYNGIDINGIGTITTI